MKIEFSKYQGAGNDFVVIDNRADVFPNSPELVKRMCDRHFGIGADGLMLLEQSPVADFHMRYFNADGNESTMCGNGGRCITLFANNIGLVNSETRFTGTDGEHRARITKPNYVSLRMKDVPTIEVGDDYYFMDTGSPHYVCFVKDVNKIDIAKEGHFIRNTYNINKGGTNANFVHVEGDKIHIRTYERGVEAETLACGTGSVASAIAYSHYFEVDQDEFEVVAPGGILKVRLKRNGENSFTVIWLEGPAFKVFNGCIDV